MFGRPSMFLSVGCEALFRSVKMSLLSLPCDAKFMDPCGMSLDS